jgi:hypothetical protein
MEIANPMYDVVFKYLMEDNAAAITFLSALTGMDIVSLTPLPQELVLDPPEVKNRAMKPFKRRLSLYRLDYTARISDREGRELIVIVEIQQERLYGQQMRFRKYLGKQFENGGFFKKVLTAGGREDEIGIPILSIYFIGERLKGIRNVPVILIGHSIVDQYGMEPVDGTNSFVEALFHKGIIVHVPFLSREGRNDLEILLSIFSPLNQTINPQIMSVQEMKFMEKYQPILRRLKAAAQDRAVRNKMDAEDDFLEEMERFEQRFEDMQRRLEAALQKEEAALQKEEAALQKEEAALQKEEAALQKEEAALQKEEAALKKEAENQRNMIELQRMEAEIQREKEANQYREERMVRLLLDIGMSKEEIAVKLGLSKEEIDRY